MADPKQVDVNIVNNKGMTPLHIAAREGITSDVKVGCK